MTPVFYTRSDLNKLISVLVLSFYSLNIAAQEEEKSQVAIGGYIIHQYFPGFNETELASGLSVRINRHYFGLQSQNPIFKTDRIFLNLGITYKYEVKAHGEHFASHAILKQGYRYNRNNSNDLVKWTQRKYEVTVGGGEEWKPVHWLYGFVNVLAGLRFSNQDYQHFILSPEMTNTRLTQFSWLIEFGGGLQLNL